MKILDKWAIKIVDYQFLSEFCHKISLTKVVQVFLTITEFLLTECSQSFCNLKDDNRYFRCSRGVWLITNDSKFLTSHGFWLVWHNFKEVSLLESPSTVGTPNKGTSNKGIFSYLSKSLKNGKYGNWQISHNLTKFLKNLAVPYLSTHCTALFILIFQTSHILKTGYQNRNFYTVS